MPGTGFAASSILGRQQHPEARSTRSSITPRQRRVQLGIRSIAPFTVPCTVIPRTGIAECLQRYAPKNTSVKR